MMGFSYYNPTAEAKRLTRDAPDPGLFAFPTKAPTKKDRHVMDIKRKLEKLTEMEDLMITISNVWD